MNGEKIDNVRYHMNSNILMSVIIALNERRQIKVQIDTKRAFCKCANTQQSALQLYNDQTKEDMGRDCTVVCVTMCAVVRVIT